MIFIARFRVRTQPAENRLDTNHDIQYYSGRIRSIRARIRISAFLIVRNDSGVVNFVGNIEQKKRIKKD